MRRLLLSAGLAAMAALPAAAQDKAPLVTVVTSENPQTQLMAMVLTMQAVEQGHAVRMLLCGPGGDLALRDAPESATAPQPPRDMSPQGLMQAIMERRRPRSRSARSTCPAGAPTLGADRGRGRRPAARDGRRDAGRRHRRLVVLTRPGERRGGGRCRPARGTAVRGASGCAGGGPRDWKAGWMADGRAHFAQASASPPC
jgi:hypothetical protein